MIGTLYFIMYIVITLVTAYSIASMFYYWRHYRQPKKAKRTSRMAKWDKEHDGRPCSGDNNIVFGYKDNYAVGYKAMSGHPNTAIGYEEGPFKPTAYDADLPEE